MLKRQYLGSDLQICVVVEQGHIMVGLRRLRTHVALKGDESFPHDSTGNRLKRFEFDDAMS